MRTKILLFAAAALAAGVVSSSAQVYSANVVGYYQVPLTPGVPALVGNQLVNGTSNDVATLCANLPNKTTVNTWNGTTFNSTQKGSGGWSPNDPQIALGQGFFIVTSASAGNQTNTFVGSVVVNIGGSITNTYPGSVSSLICSPIPYAGTLTDTSNINLGTLPNKTTINVWNSGTLTYNSTQKGSGGWSPSVFSISVGQGFFIVPPAAGATLIQTLPNN
jgi:hypothetical protein